MVANDILCLSIYASQGRRGDFFGQVAVLFPVEKGAPTRGMLRDALQCMLSVLMNLTHDNAAGCTAVVGAGGLATAAGIIDSILGPLEEEAVFVRLADRSTTYLTPCRFRIF
jgi:hypothetical protein